MSSLKDDKPPCARLCHIVKWDDFPGYGFNLHAQKGKNGQFIGKVDDGSPSQAAGLRQGDRIIEVNEIDIANETHNQVVERIKAFANETKLLVVDEEADDYFRENNIIIKGAMPNIKVIKTPERNPNSVEDRSDGSNCSVDEVRMLPLFSLSPALRILTLDRIEHMIYYVDVAIFSDLNGKLCNFLF
ncbi:na+ h+ exchange regulatory cofactor nhe-rf2 [Lasius niger]|uniref:Na+ h+ exchange regulatory cofactor nhe-rf2 n=1 Tax=Lasius niger TaxID=67767 RepID=A0A0J7KZ32_LASNI|nr:na+ h+ exchange regulatory cofactor nhe-rf2 [Lasius niger]